MHYAKTIAAFAAVMLLASLAACNTVQGMGQDIKGAGEAISTSSQKTKQKMSQ